MSRQPFFLPSIIFVALAIPLVLNLVPPNRLYGVRTRRTLISDEIWYRSNHFGGWDIIAACAAYLAVAWLIPYRRGTPDDFRIWLLHLAGFAGPLGLAIVAILRKVRSP